MELVDSRECARLEEKRNRDTSTSTKKSVCSALWRKCAQCFLEKGSLGWQALKLLARVCTVTLAAVRTWLAREFCGRPIPTVPHSCGGVFLWGLGDLRKRQRRGRRKMIITQAFCVASSNIDNLNN